MASDFLEGLARRTVICYTGQSRVSGTTIADVMGRYRDGDPVVGGALDRMAEIADRMADAMEAEDFGVMGRLLAENWACQRSLHPAMCTPRMAELDAAMRDAGALGGKAAGAGAGGSMFFLMGDDATRGEAVAREMGTTVLSCRWRKEGVSTC
jgi:D-glycero-alpha-D-manno-heptose-7-phosphate kinase